MKLCIREWSPSFVALLCVAACSSSNNSPGPGGGAGSPAIAGAPAGGAMNGSGGAATSGAPSTAGAPAAGASTTGGASATGGSSAAGASGASLGGTSSVAGAGGAVASAGAGAGGAVGSAGAGGSGPKGTFFVTSDTSMTANLGGLVAADARCQALAVAAGFGSHTFHAYLSADHDPSDANKVVNARDRIGMGPWYNSVGALLAQDLTALHALSGNADLFLDEKGKKINGQWVGSPAPVQHDVLTGSTAMGTLIAGKTCMDWTSASATLTAQVGHADGLGPNQSATPPLNSWNSAHENGSCADTGPKGGAGRLYCFAIN